MQIHTNLPERFNDKLRASAWYELQAFTSTPLIQRLPDAQSVKLYDNDYLAMARHPAILQAKIAALQAEQNTIFMSNVFRDMPVFGQVEAEFASFLQADAVVFCQSGYAANLGLLQTIALPKQPIYLDYHAHMSLWEGSLSGGGMRIAFRHNHCDDLQIKIREHGPGIVCIDSIYSGDGSVAPLPEMVAICQANDCVLVVDESHALGVYGERGEGMVAALGLQKQVHFRTASLSKAFVTRAGLIAATVDFKDYFRHASYPAIFSSSLLPYEASSLLAALQVIQQAQDRRSRLQENVRYFRRGLAQIGYPAAGSEQIIALFAGAGERVFRLRNALEAENIIGAPFVPPATNKNGCVMRLSLNSTLQQAQLAHVVEVCQRLLQEGVLPVAPEH